MHMKRTADRLFATTTAGRCWVAVRGRCRSPRGRPPWEATCVSVWKTASGSVPASSSLHPSRPGDSGSKDHRRTRTGVRRPTVSRDSALRAATRSHSDPATIDAAAGRVIDTDGISMMLPSRVFMTKSTTVRELWSALCWHRISHPIFPVDGRSRHHLIGSLGSAGGEGCCFARRFPEPFGGAGGDFRHNAIVIGNSATPAPAGPASHKSKSNPRPRPPTPPASPSTTRMCGYLLPLRKPGTKEKRFPDGVGGTVCAIAMTEPGTEAICKVAAPGRCAR